MRYASYYDTYLEFNSLMQYNMCSVLPYNLLSNITYIFSIFHLGVILDFINKYK